MELISKKLELLEKQKSIANELHQILTGPNGLNENSKKTCKNLEAAVVQSKRPGYFVYYEQSDQIKTIEKSGQVKQLQQHLEKIELEIQKINQEIEQSENRKLSNSIECRPDVQSFKEWFAIYGVPSASNTTAMPGKFSTFVANDKVYGGTNHHYSFKTQSKTMKKGKLTQ